MSDFEHAHLYRCQYTSYVHCSQFYFSIIRRTIAYYSCAQRVENADENALKRRRTEYSQGEAGRNGGFSSIAAEKEPWVAIAGSVERETLTRKL